MKPPNGSLGLRRNWFQFSMLVLINAFVGAMIGLERTLIPLVAVETFGLVSRSAALSFLVSFGITKALANLLAGRMSDRLGRKPTLVTGWLFGLPVPLIIILAPSWGWVIFANVLLGINQGLTWSTTINMKVDLVGPGRRGLALGLNEFSGYLAVSLTALMTGYLASRYGLRPAPFYPGIVFALLGLFLSAFFARETHAHARQEAQDRPTAHAPLPDPAPHHRSFREILLLTAWKDPALSAASQAGMVRNLTDGTVWGLVPLFLTGAGLPLEQVGLVVALYPGVWGVAQLFTGFLSDHLGRKKMIVMGMWTQALGIGLFALGKGFPAWLGGSVLLGAGTALVYPTLLAVVSDVAHPHWRATAIGAYRLWRDAGYAIGALLAGFLADRLGIPFTFLAVAGLVFLSGAIVGLRMYETLPALHRA